MIVTVAGSCEVGDTFTIGGQRRVIVAISHSENPNRTRITYRIDGIGQDIVWNVKSDRTIRIHPQNVSAV